MFGDVALPLQQFSAVQVVQHGLIRRVHNRNGSPEVQFLARDAEQLLPVFYGLELRIVRWGNRGGGELPKTLWTLQATIDSGAWADAGAEEVVIPASMGFDAGIWFAVTKGIRGLLVPDEKGEKRVYIICEPASPYYGVMTKSQWMPSLVDQQM